jgi:hypothetical protein
MATRIDEAQLTSALGGSAQRTPPFGRHLLDEVRMHHHARSIPANIGQNQRIRLS